MNFDPNQLAQVLVQRGGYNPTDAANASTGPRAEELAREFGVSGGAETGQVLGSSDGGGDLISLARQSLELQKEFNQPAISSLEGAIGGIKDRYAKLLETFKPQAETTRTQEFGRRGIPISSTSAQEGIQKAGRDVATGLAAQEQQDITPLQTAIAQLQSGGGPGDILGNALQLQQLGEQRRQFDITSGQTQQRLDQTLGGSSGGGGGGIIDFGAAAAAFGGDPSGLQQSTSPTLGSASSTNNLSGSDLFRQRVLSGQGGSPTVTTSNHRPQAIGLIPQIHNIFTRGFA